MSSSLVARLVVCPVHVDPELGPPLGDGQREDGVHADGAQGHEAELGPAGGGEDGADEAELEERGRDVEHDGREHRGDAAGAAVDCLG